MNTASISFSVSPLRRIVAGLILLMCLVQILLFYVGLIQTTRRIAAVWGRNLEERRAMLSQPWGVFKSIADRFPMAARIYLIYPEQHVHDVVNYYFYPRFISVSKTNSAYRLVEEYDQWVEMPDDQWLITNRYTHVLSFRNGGHAWSVQPGVVREITDRESSHANR